MIHHQTYAADVCGHFETAAGRHGFARLQQRVQRDLRPDANRIVSSPLRVHQVDISRPHFTLRNTQGPAEDWESNLVEGDSFHRRPLRFFYRHAPVVKAFRLANPKYILL